MVGSRNTKPLGTVPQVVEMSSEAGVAGTLQTRALVTTFTASPGLVLMLPNIYQTAGELTPIVTHVETRALAAESLPMFDEHSDVMTAHATGFAVLASHSIQAAQDLAVIAHAGTT